MSKSGSQKVPLSLLVVSAAFFGAAYFTVRFPDTPGTSTVSYVATIAIALPSIVAIFRYMGARRATLALLVLSVFGYVIEGFGVSTGIPYGTFFYGESLGPKLFGLAPYILPVSYVPLVIGAVAATGGRTGRRGIVAWTLSSALLLVLLDGVLDPGAASLGFWDWPEGGLYYGVPVSNYLGWMLSGAIASFLLLRAGRWGGPPLPGLLDSVIVAVAFWTGVSVFSSLMAPILLGASLFVYLIWRRYRLSKFTPHKNGYKLGGRLTGRYL